MSIFHKLRQILDPKKNPTNNKNLSVPNNPDNTDEATVYKERLNATENDKKKRVDLLTPRERDLYYLLLEGFTLKESAKQLSVQYSTANTHMTGIYRKLEVSSRAELIIHYRGVGTENNKEL